MSKYQPNIDLDAITAIDVHTHAETSARRAPDAATVEFQQYMAKYFKESARPTIPEVAAYYRER
jgi:hypothetical protein